MVSEGVWVFDRGSSVGAACGATRSTQRQLVDQLAGGGARRIFSIALPLASSSMSLSR